MIASAVKGIADPRAVTTDLGGLVASIAFSHACLAKAKPQDPALCTLTNEVVLARTQCQRYGAVETAVKRVSNGPIVTSPESVRDAQLDGGYRCP